MSARPSESPGAEPPVWQAVSRAIAERVAGLSGPETVAGRLARARDDLAALRAGAVARERRRIDAALGALQAVEALLDAVSAPDAGGVVGLRLEAFRRLSLALAQKTEERRGSAQRPGGGADHRADPPIDAGSQP